MVSALSENVARIAPVFDANGNEIQTKTKVVYESQESKEKLSLHKYSTLNKRKPELVAYCELYKLEDFDKLYLKECV